MTAPAEPDPDLEDRLPPIESIRLTPRAASALLRILRTAGEREAVA